MLVDDVYDILVGPFVGGDESEVICIRKADESLNFKRISKLLYLKPKRFKDGIGDHEEDNRIHKIACENASFESEWLRKEKRSFDNRLGLVV